MALTKLSKTGNWSGESDKINTNFDHISTELTKLGLSSRKMKGLFSTIEELKSAIPIPTKGDWAIVGSTVPGPIYKYTNGTWTATGQTGGGSSVELVGYLKAEVITDITSILE